MARLYTRTGASHVYYEDAVYEVEENQSVEVPPEVAAHLQHLHVAGQKAWEDDAERQTRIEAEELARRRDPAAVYDMLTRVADQGGPLPSVDPAVFQAAIDKAVQDALAKEREEVAELARLQAEEDAGGQHAAPEDDSKSKNAK
jgi:hypothetical protein